MAIQAINSLMPIQMVAIEHLYALYADCKPTSFSLARASLTPSRWLVFCRHMLRQPASLELLLSLPVLTSLYERFERRRQQAHESKGQAASPLGVGPFIGLLCEVADHWERRNALAPPEPPSSPSSSGYRAAAAATTCPTTSPDRGLFEAVRQKLRLPADLPRCSTCSTELRDCASARTSFITGIAWKSSTRTDIARRSIRCVSNR